MGKLALTREEARRQNEKAFRRFEVEGTVIGWFTPPLCLVFCALAYFGDFDDSSRLFYWIIAGVFGAIALAYWLIQKLFE